MFVVGYASGQYIYAQTLESTEKNHEAIDLVVRLTTIFLISLMIDAAS